MFELRDYQSETIDNIYSELKQGRRSLVVQQPPRTGKTVIMAEIARRTTAKGNRVLFIVHRIEIVEQVIQTFKQQGVNMDLCKVGMVQTFTRRISKLDKPDLILIDEAHHVLADSYMRIVNNFPEAIKLMFTATPYRMSGQGFEEVADGLIEGKQVSWLIEHHRLSPVDYYAPKSINEKLLKTRKGEFSNKSIDEAIKPKIYGDAVKHYQKIAKGTNAIAYCHSVDSAKKLADEFNQSGIKAVEVDGSTDANDREQIITDFKNGKIKVLTNVELFTEGLDLPGVDTVIQLRPTQSLSLYLQFAMRSMNYREGKTAKIIDHVGNVERFGLPTQDRHWTLKSKNKRSKKEKSDVVPVTVCSQCFSTFYRVGNECPVCHAELKVNKAEIDVDENAELTKIQERKQARTIRLQKMMKDEVYKNIIGKSPADLKSMAELKAYAKLHNYKDGWVFYQAKQKGLIRIR